LSDSYGIADEAGAADFFPDGPDVEDINEGALELLPVRPSGPVHAHSNRITLTADSLQDGWADLYQCHRHLDAVAAAQVVYNRERVRRIQVEQSGGIGRARVEGTTVQLENVTASAVLCIRAESRIVWPQSANRFVVRNGPFMRKFLDGYYPMHVTLEIILPPGDWVLEKSEPATQPGFNVTRTATGVVADAWFAGELETEFHFAPDQTK
jgi:hypothetical protein